jgi:hypothetical protein
MQPFFFKKTGHTYRIDIRSAPKDYRRI